MVFKENIKKGDFMKKVQSLLEEANRLFERAEVTVKESMATGSQLFLQGVALLFRAFLNANGVEGTGDLLGLFYECKQLEPNFADIREELDCLLEADLAGLDSEDLSDTANEIWDFVIDFVSDDDIQ
jgi:hypothetical protein